jgi:hypothetical protein
MDKNICKSKKRDNTSINLTSGYLFKKIDIPECCKICKHLVAIRNEVI